MPTQPTASSSTGDGCRVHMRAEQVSDGRRPPLAQSLAVSRAAEVVGVAGDLDRARSAALQLLGHPAHPTLGLAVDLGIVVAERHRRVEGDPGLGRGRLDLRLALQIGVADWMSSTGATLSNTGAVPSAAASASPGSTGNDLRHPRPPGRPGRSPRPELKAVGCCPAGVADIGVVTGQHRPQARGPGTAHLKIHLSRGAVAANWIHRHGDLHAAGRGRTGGHCLSQVAARGLAGIS